MSDEHLIKENPFAPTTAGDAGAANTSGDHASTSLAVRIGYGAPESKTAGSATKTDNTKPTTSRTAEVLPHQTGDAPQKTSDQTRTAGDRAAASTNTQAIYDIQNLYAQVQNMQKTLMSTCYDKQPDGSYKPKDDKAKVDDGSKDGSTVEVVRSVLISQMSAKFEQAVQMADGAMKNPDAVIGATMSLQRQLEATQQQTKQIETDLKAKGIDPSAGGYLDSTMVTRYMEAHKDQRAELEPLLHSMQKQSQLELKYRDLHIMEETPVVTRQSYAEFLRTIGLPNAADKWMKDAKTVSDEMNSPAGRSEFMKKALAESSQVKNDSFDQNLQNKYLKPEQHLEKLMLDASNKAKAGDVAAARAEMDQARLMAAKMPAVDPADENQIKMRGDQLQKDREALNQKLKEGTATPYDVTMQQEKELKLVNEARLLDAVKLAKPNVEIAYADFLLNADKDKGSESNRKQARDILMNVKFDNLGKIAAAQNGEQFDKLMEQALDGSVNNQASMKAFNTAMQQYDALKQKAATESKDEDVAKDLQAARSKAAEAAQIASGINRDGADGNEKSVMGQLQKEINDEMAKPAAQRDQGKINLLQAVMTPTYRLTPQQKDLIAGLTECMKPEAQANKALIDKLSGTLKDKTALFDAVSSYSMIQQMEFQKQALNQARIAMLDIDVAFGKGENNPLVGEIEHDKYGGDMIAALNSIPGHDGRTQWGDIKEATRDLAWYEKAWNWTKGALKEVAISLASWGVGALAGLGAAALFSWSGPGAIIGGGAVGFAAGAATGSAIRYALGDKLTPLGVVMDGVSGLTGGVMGTTYAVARGAGAAAMENVISQQAGRGVTIGANQTWQAFKAAGMADKFAIAAGGSPFLASFSAATAGSVANRIPSEALTGNYNNFGDYLKGTGIKIAEDVPGDLFMAWVGGGKVGRVVESKVLAGGGGYFKSATRQLASNFLWTSPEGKSLFGTTAQLRRSQFNAPLYDLVQPKPGDKTNK